MTNDIPHPLSLFSFETDFANQLPLTNPVTATRAENGTIAWSKIAKHEERILTRGEYLGYPTLVFLVGYLLEISSNSYRKDK